MKRREYIALLRRCSFRHGFCGPKATPRRIGCFGILENAEEGEVGAIVWVPTVLLALLLVQRRPRLRD